MKEAYRKRCAKDPNSPRALLEGLWEEFPELVLANPALPLLLLEDPGWWVPRHARRRVAVRNYYEAHLALFEEGRNWWLREGGSGSGATGRNNRGGYGEGCQVGAGDGHGRYGFQGNAAGFSSCGAGDGQAYGTGTDFGTGNARGALPK